jgi:hypothetical protein
MPRVHVPSSRRVVASWTLLVASFGCRQTMEPARDAGAMLAPTVGAAAGTAAAGASGSAGSLPAADSGSIASQVAMEPPCSGDLPVMSGFDAQTGSTLEPDWSCYLSITQSDADAGVLIDPGTAPSAVIEVSYAPGNNVPFPAAMIDQFFAPSALGKPAYSGIADAAGRLMFPAPAGTERISLHVHAVADPMNPIGEIVDTYAFDVPFAWPPHVVKASAYVTVAVDATIVNVLGSAELGDKTKAILYANVRDCQGRDVGGAQVELIDVATQAPVAVGTAACQPFGVYGRFALPDTTCTFTTAQRSEWMLLNAPVNVSNGAVSQAFKVRAKGRMRASDVEPVILDERPVELHSGAFINAYPYRVSPAAAP